MGDDLFFIGAAINLAKTGELNNPWLSMWSEQTIDRFFVQPPFHSYTLAGWIVLFGNNTNSILFFQCICYCLFSIFAALILRKYKFSGLSIFCVPVVYTTWMAIAGLRQDALGMAYLAIGLWGLIRDSSLRYFWGCLFLGLAICTSPVLISYAIPFSLGIAIANLTQKSKLNGYYFLKRILALISAVFVVLFLLLWAIDFELFHFLADLSWHASFRVVPIARVIPEVTFIITNGYGEIIYGSLYTIYLILLFFLIKNRKRSQNCVVYFAFILNLSLAINILLYASTLYYNFNFFCWLGVVIFLFNINTSRISRTLLVFLCIVAFLIYQSQLIVGVIGQNSPAIDKYKSILEWVKKNPDRNYAIDDVAARFVFDYNLPEHSIAWNFSNNPAIFWPTSVSQKNSNTIWIISPAKAALTPDLPDYQRVELFNHRFNSIPRSPYDIVIIE
ncbi:MAG: hypothetical protein J7647_03010 [Cyanobacteria bacterium SBLK]|nr:hypothetical protein [Cyanobacteria bacterium SBLK]